MHVGLKVGEWQASISLDEVGSDWQSAMARTVSLTVALAVLAVLKGELQTGVQVAPHDPVLCRKWLASHRAAGMVIRIENIEI
jgi:saccharopine dehydrogenase (NADP+, L-glutamate forming)